MPDDVTAELRVWLDVLPIHQGMEIHPPKAVAAIAIGADTGADASCGFFDAGDGRRHIAREELRSETGKQTIPQKEVFALARRYMVEAGWMKAPKE